eukprot:scaffold1362_cov163-Amphora_coffeaeformis.AAC.12
MAAAPPRLAPAMQNPLPPVTLLMKELSVSTLAAAEKLVTPIVQHTKSQIRASFHKLNGQCRSTSLRVRKARHPLPFLTKCLTFQIRKPPTEYIHGVGINPLSR